MCFDSDSHPPVTTENPGRVERHETTLTANDGARFRAFHAQPANPTGNAIVILPDVRGLHPYYEELAVCFAELGVEALAIDYFGRTAGTTKRGDEFDHQPHLAQTTWEGLSADITAAAEFLRAEDSGSRTRALFTTGFCMGGRLAFASASLGLGLAGVIGWYGWPAGPHRAGTPAPVEIASSLDAPILGIFGGADQGITKSVVDEFERALTAAGKEHEIVVEPDAPHSFFDRKREEFQAQSDDAWARVRRFIETHGVR